MNKYCIISLVAIATFSLVCTAAPKPSESGSEALLQARIYKYQLRAGQYDVAPLAVEILQHALKSDPDNVQLLNELGTAYLMRMTAVSHSVGKPEDVPVAVQGAFETFSRAAAIDPDDAYARTGRGMSRILVSRRDTNEMKTGMADLNAGVELDPTNIPARLMRAFTSLAVPADIRGTATIEADLEFLGNVARGTKAADVLGVLLADIYVETGRRDAAQRNYERIAQQTSFAADAARTRLAALKNGGHVSAEHIARLRANLGRQCTMCHGQ